MPWPGGVKDLTFVRRGVWLATKTRLEKELTSEDKKEKKKKKPKGKSGERKKQLLKREI